MTQPTPPEWSRLVHVLIVGGAAVVMFFLGTKHLEHDRSSKPNAEPAREAKAAHPARSYEELKANPYKANPGSVGTLEALHATRPDITERVARQPERLTGTLTERASRRAFAGAPPTVPHPVKQRGDLDCLSCHRAGVEIAGRVAPAMSHEPHAACTQCHVPSSAPHPAGDPDTASPPFESAFVPLAEAPHGARAWEGAPPTIPHATHMRERCSSCHGVMGKPGMRTSHPERVQCTQCHAPSAELDQYGLDVPFPPNP